MLLRPPLEQPSLTSSGEFFAVEGMSVRPLPTRPPDLWLGGRGIVLLTCLWSGVHFLAR